MTLDKAFYARRKNDNAAEGNLDKSDVKSKHLEKTHQGAGRHHSTVESTESPRGADRKCGNPEQHWKSR